MLPKDKVRASCCISGKASRMAADSRSKSHFSHSWLLIKNISCSLLSKSPNFSEESSRMAFSMASSLNDRFLFSARIFSSIFVRMKKNFLPRDLILVANSKSLMVNRVAVKMRKVSYTSSCTFLQYVSRSGWFGVPISGKSQNFILGLVG